ncbi:hypothetical protein ANO14919_033980 [Xylariales sp. No.14919]|nr:hypothetical protein ANO14919_033980 [Xylariales sp. No.14919]
MTRMDNFDSQMGKNIHTRAKKIREEVQIVLKEYGKPETQRLYEELTKFASDECKNLLKNTKKKVKGVVHGRTKDYDSLKKKLKDLQDQDNLEDLEKNQKSKEQKYNRRKNKPENLQADPNRSPGEYGFLKKHVANLKKELKNQPQQVPNFRAWVAWGGSVYEHPEMGDLAGVRIGLYLPDDIPTVAKKIDKHFNRKWLFGTVTGGRNIIMDRNLDVQKHLNGRWHSEGPDGTVEHWEHYGYKSWQVVVELKEPLCEELESFRETMKRLGLKSLRVEIQIGTVVTQAWAEVQHNIIYKNPDNIVATRTMRRMIDAINGLAITTDIMLRELERGLEKAGQQHFKDGAEFLSWFQSRYMSKMEEEERQRWDCDEAIATQLIDVLRFIKLEKSQPRPARWERHVPIPCRDKFKKLIEKKRLHKLEKETAKADISKLIIRSMNVDINNLSQEIELLQNRRSQLRKQTARRAQEHTEQPNLKRKASEELDENTQRKKGKVEGPMTSAYFRQRLVWLRGQLGIHT